MYTPRKLLAKKLCRLSSFLHHACEEFENITKQIRAKNIRMGVRSVVIKTEQYERELNSQLYMLQIKGTTERLNNFKEKDSKRVNNKNMSDKKIIELCCNSEVFFSNAYHSILNEYFPYKPLRDMLRYQLTGIYDAFRQLKLLNSVITPHVIEEAVISY